MRQEIGIGQILNLAKEYQNLERQTQNFVETAASKKEDTLQPLENTTLNTLSMLGVSPNAMKIIQTTNALNLKSSLPVEFMPSPDIYSLLLSDSTAASERGHHALTYFNLCEKDFLPPWLPPEAVGGVAVHIKEDYSLATDATKKDALTLINGLNKVYGKKKFFNKK